MTRIRLPAPRAAFAHLAAAALLALPTALAAGPLRSLGISVLDLGNPFFVAIAESAEARARTLAGEVDVAVVSSAYNLPRQEAQIERFVREARDLIVLSASEPDGIANAVRRAQAAGTRVVAVDVEAAGADATVTTDNAQAGRIACEHMAASLDGRGQVVIINGPPVSAVKARVAGCREVLANHPGIELLSAAENGGGSRRGGLEKMTALLTRHPGLDAVFAINDPTALGAELAAQRSGHEDVFIVSVDGSPAVVERLKGGDSLIRATAAQFPGRIARRAVELGYDILRGREPSPTRVYIPSRLITADNVAGYEGWEQ